MHASHDHELESADWTAQLTHAGPLLGQRLAGGNLSAHGSQEADHGLSRVEEWVEG